jgi:ABC-type uncharacterized transport system involved in gliding motility auxiliary subunit
MKTPDAEPSDSFSIGRKFGFGTNTFIAVVALVLVAAMLNYLASRHFKRFALSLAAKEQLSPLTTQILRSLTEPVKITIYYDPDETLYGAITELLKEYQNLSPKLISLDTVNYDLEPAKAELIKTQYKLPPQAKDLIIFECRGKVRTVTQAELSDYDVSKLLSGESREVKRKAFLGERLFTSAIRTVADTQTPKAFYLIGHGEHELGNALSDYGFGKFGALLRENGIAVAPLPLTGTNDIPADAQLVLIAGATRAFDPAEIDKLERYLIRGGRLFLMLNYRSRTGIEALLGKWGVDVGTGVVVDEKFSRSNSSVIVGNYGSHPVVGALAQANLPLQMILPRPILKTTAAQVADAPQVVELATSSTEGIAVNNLQDGVPRPNPATDPQGAIPLMAAVEKGSIKDVNLDRGSTRLVVTGDSFFLGNKLIEAAANRDFAWHSVNWLLDRSQLLGGIGPRKVTSYTLTITKGQTRNVRWILLAGVPGFIVLLGVMVWFRRRY